jgi:RNA polymerase sigma factor (sigma-70 family)
MMTLEPDTPPAVNKRSDFSTTRWSIVMLARDHKDLDSKAALEELCKAYWYPLYCFARRTGATPHDAQDLTQDFFTHLLRTEALDTVDQSKGRFRSFLLASFRNVITNEWRRATTQKRGGGAIEFSLDAEAPEQKFKREIAGTNLSPEQAFEKRWAETLVDRSLERLRMEWERDGKPFDKLKIFLVGQKREARIADLAGELSVSESALKTAIHRMRRRYGDIFREEVAQTVAKKEDVGHLLSALCN